MTHFQSQFPIRGFKRNKNNTNTGVYIFLTFLSFMIGLLLLTAIIASSSNEANLGPCEGEAPYTQCNK